MLAPGAPRFLLTFTPCQFHSLKAFVTFLCHETGLIENSPNERDVEIVGKSSYLLMLDDSIVLNMQSIRDNDRLSLIPSSSLNNYITGFNSKLIGP